MKRDRRDSQTPRLISAASTTEKRAFIQDLHAAAERGDSVFRGTVLEDVRLLAVDPEWQVRLDIANLLVFVPDNLFEALAPALLHDSTAYVHRAATASRNRRRIAHEEAKRASRGVDLFIEEFDTLVRHHGPEVAAQAARLGDRRFELMAATLAHDLIGILDNVSSHHDDLATARTNLSEGERIAIREVSDGLRLIKGSLTDLLLYAQKIPSERTSEHIAPLLHKAQEIAVDSLVKQGLDCAPVSIRIAPVPPVPLLMARHLILSALGNLIKNAIESFADKDGKFAPGRISINTHKTSSQLQIVIHNTGPGLSPEKLAALTSWVPGRSNRRKKFSTGFGLLNAKKNIEAHAGTLSFSSLPDQGVTATISLPL